MIIRIPETGNISFLKKFVTSFGMVNIPKTGKSTKGLLAIRLPV
jgi:hypothetical protein